jgi:hypothetical protein
MTLNAAIYFTGHSRGASLALLAADRWFANWSGPSAIAGVFAFAPARPGNAAFRDRYNARLGNITWCFQHSADVVPWEPPWLLGNRGVGQQVWFAPYLTTPMINPPLWLIGLSCAAVTIAGWRKRPPQIEQLADHHVSTYVKLLI